jgi:exodeoxyribonuclease V alpha subunit
MLVSGNHGDLVWRPLPAGRTFEVEFINSVREGYDAYIRASSPEKALAELESFRVLSPLRSGMYGVENLNKLSLAALGLGRMTDEQFYRLMPVGVTGNNYELGLFNGDTGVVTEHDGRPAAWFNDQDGGLRHISPLRLPPYETAFALTVHKSQGSEFDKLLFILPDRMSEALSRELLYTAVTRARHHVEIWGTEDVFREAVERRTERSSGLRDRLAVRSKSCLKSG